MIQGARRLRCLPRTPRCAAAVSGKRHERPWRGCVQCVLPFYLSNGSGEVGSTEVCYLIIVALASICAHDLWLKGYIIGWNMPIFAIFFCHAPLAAAPWCHVFWCKASFFQVDGAIAGTARSVDTPSMNVEIHGNSDLSSVGLEGHSAEVRSHSAERCAEVFSSLQTGGGWEVSPNVRLLEYAECSLSLPGPHRTW